MIDWLKKLTRRRPAPLVGAPAVRRQKTYSAESGYVYQYYYEGQRQARRGDSYGTEYVFVISADRKNSFPVSVFLDEEAVIVWEEEHDRELIGSERYAIAKMGLFQAFDERANPGQMKEDVLLRPIDVEAILSMLDID
jgi:hypothetical protein